MGQIWARSGPDLGQVWPNLGPNLAQIGRNLVKSGFFWTRPGSAKIHQNPSKSIKIHQNPSISHGNRWILMDFDDPERELRLSFGPFLGQIWPISGRSEPDLAQIWARNEEKVVQIWIDRGPSKSIDFRWVLMENRWISSPRQNPSIFHQNRWKIHGF